MLFDKTFTTDEHSRTRLRQRFLLNAQSKLSAKCVFVGKYKHKYNDADISIYFTYIQNKPALLLAYTTTQQLITVYTTPTKKSQNAFWNRNVRIAIKKLKAAA